MGTKDMTRVQSSSSCFRIRHPHYEGLFNQSKADIAQKLATLKQYGTAAEALDPLRVESLQNVFETTINEYTVTFAPLLREIKREYDLVIAAHISQKAEKAYLRTKIQTLLCEIGSEQQADDLRSTLVKQTLWNQLIEKENDRLRENLEEEDTQFLLRLAHKCVESPPGTQQSDRQRHLLRHKEGWSTVLKWMTEYSLHDVVLRELLEKIERDQEKYKSIVEKETLSLLTQHKAATTPAAKRQDELVQEHEEALKLQREQYADLEVELRSLFEETAEITEKIEALEVLIDVNKRRLAANTAGSSEAGATLGSAI